MAVLFFDQIGNGLAVLGGDERLDDAPLAGWEKMGQSFIFNLTAPSAPWKHFFMARPLRIQYPGVWYHVTSRGNERRRI